MNNYFSFGSFRLLLSPMIGSAAIDHNPALDMQQPTGDLNRRGALSAPIGLNARPIEHNQFFSDGVL